MFIVRSLPRTGTHLMRSSLDNHPELECRDEIFHQKLYKEDVQQGVMHVLKKWITAPNVGFVVHDYTYGMQPYAVPIYENLWRLITLWTPPMIHLHRRDVLRMAASREIASRTQCWNQDAATDPRENPAVTLRAEAVQSVYADVQRFAQRTQEMFTWGYTVYYEDLVFNFDAEMIKIQQHLPVIEIVTVQPKTRKLDTRPIREIISNYEQLCDQLWSKGLKSLITIAEENDEQRIVPARRD